MAAKTGKGYEKHGNKYRVKVRENGQARYVSFATEAEAHAFATSPAAYPVVAYHVDAQTRSTRDQRHSLAWSAGRLSSACDRTFGLPLQSPCSR